MKRIIFIAIIVLSTSVLHAQRDADFYKHEVKVSVGDALLAQALWTYDAWSDRRQNANLYVNLSFSYFYRPIKWFWVGGNFINYFGSTIYYTSREYYPDGSFYDSSKSKMKYCAAIAPEIRFSYLNQKVVILYSGISSGICIENGYDSNRYKYPEVNYYLQITLLGVSGNLGKNNNIFLGGEFGFGHKGFGNVHFGYRF